MSIRCTVSRLTCAARRFLELTATLAALAIGAGRAEATTLDDVLADFRAAQNSLHDSYRLFQEEDEVAASLALQQALTVVDVVLQNLDDPSIAPLLGQKLDAVRRKTGSFQNRIRHAREYLEGGAAKAKVFLGKVTSTWTFGQRAADMIRKPMLALNGSSAGFLEAGKRATFRFALPADCSPDSPPPVVEVANVFGARAIDTANVLVDENRGMIHVPMGPESGSGRVTVTACGRTDTILLYNKGSGLPDGFPTNLRTGLYRLSYSIDGGPSIAAGTVRLTNLRTFAKDVQRIVGRAVASIQLPGECTKMLAWHAATETRFGCTFTVRCTVEGIVVSSTGTFVIERI